MRRQLLASAMMLLVLTVMLGFGYPLAVTGLSQLFFHKQANGSLVYRDGKLVGSSLLGQSFTDAKGNPLPQYFQPRPSDAGTGYQGNESGASNLGPSNPLLVGFIPGVNISAKRNPYATPADPACVPVDLSGNPVSNPSPGQKYERADGEYACDPDTVPERAIAYRQFNDLAATASVPVDAVTASASGLDPGISLQNALDQASRVARFRHVPTATVLALVHTYTQGRQLDFLGEPTVNVLELNLALDDLK
jgi:potassium-transporting ATPase KdpC subunit